jgi:hypothetical protein
MQECDLASVPAASAERLRIDSELRLLAQSPVSCPEHGPEPEDAPTGPGPAGGLASGCDIGCTHCAGAGMQPEDAWTRLAGLPLGQAALEATYLLLGDPSNPVIDAEELQRLCSTGPEMSEEEYRVYIEGVKAMLVDSWRSWGETPEAVEAMLANLTSAEVPSGSGGV